MDEFKRLGLSDDSIEALKKKGYLVPTTIQIKVIPLLLHGKKDVVGQSQTGTGKTAGFALPILEKIKSHSNSVKAIIMTPTRELALQVSKEFESLKGSKDIRVLAVYGGAPIGPQRQKLKSGVDIVVGTPGRVIDLIERKSLKLDNIAFAVLDEADEMLNMGFIDDIESILNLCPKEKKMLLFSATIPRPILNIAKKYMRDYELIEIEKAQMTINTVEQFYFEVAAKDRLDALKRILDYYTDFHGIIFCNTRAAVDELSHDLSKLGYSAAALHGDITQAQREKTLQQFKNRSVRVLIATDVAARGIDVSDLTHVINHSLPQSPEAYVHRIGRTGRAGKKGIALTFVIPSERRKLGFVERIIKRKITRQRLPTPAQIVAKRESEIKDIISNIITAGRTAKYQPMAELLLKDNPAKDVVCAVLKYAFKDSMDLGSYKDISESPSETSRKRSGKPRFRRDRGSHDRGGKDHKKRSNADRGPKKKFFRR